MGADFDADVVIAGGGLAGACTALALAKRGLSCVVVDKAEFPRDKPCGEGLLPHGALLLHELGAGDVVDACEGQQFRGITYRCHGVVARGDFMDGARGFGVRRRLLDDALRTRAAAKGGVRFERAGVRSIELDERGARVLVEEPGAERTGAAGFPGKGSRLLRARFLVGADGPRSTVRHALGLDGGAPAPERARYALRRHFHLREDLEMPERVEVHVRDGYELYVTPVAPRTLGVAALCEKRVLAGVTARVRETHPEKGSGGGVEARLKALIASCPDVARLVERTEPDGPALACGPLRVKARDVGRGRAFLVGDAAGYVDAITGEGMSLAIGGAMALADAITGAVDAGETPAALDAARARYRKARWRAFRDHAILTFGLVELARRPFLARRAIARLAREPALFSRLLAVNDGTRSLASLGLVDLLKLAIGSSPGPAALPAAPAPSSSAAAGASER